MLKIVLAVGLGVVLIGRGASAYNVPFNMGQQGIWWNGVNNNSAGFQYGNVRGIPGRRHNNNSRSNNSTGATRSRGLLGRVTDRTPTRPAAAPVAAPAPAPAAPVAPAPRARTLTTRSTDATTTRSPRAHGLDALFNRKSR